MTKIAAITVLAVLFTSSKAFSIGALPATITAGEGELLTWVRNPVEPTSFQLATGTLALERIDATVSVGTGETQGTLPVTFKAPRRVTLVAYDLHLEVRLGHQA
ncbi:hypothetical protein E1B28_013098 [Marasmius oreades]|uniref:Uncharacterized protein n=1 Tax=Marasmius oreades TaxID=181124 RepID=A0A9P7RP72_9AGAR|nr:uncharacterized protein E1B28_013098 [Marasmius oreades]KAG7087117.1 hypothetical protein E1B28_013098 [Marasmius oreades]